MSSIAGISASLAPNTSALKRAGVRRVPIVPLLIVALLVFTAVFGPLLVSYSPTQGQLGEHLRPPAWIEGGSSAHILGTDRFGRDLLTRLVYGARVSLALSLVAIFLSGAVGTVIGLIAGYYSGWIDATLMRVVDITLSLPIILLAVLFAALWGASFTNVLIIVAIFLWPRYARQVRGEVLSIMEQDYVALARVAGISPARIMVRHLLPNVTPSLLVLATLQVGFVIIFEATLSFLGVGVPPPEPAWGVMVSDGRGLLRSAWWISLFPGLAIVLVVLSLNLIGDWLRDRLDPKLRQL